MMAAALVLALMQGQGAEALSERALKMAQAGRAGEAEALWKRAVEIAPGHFASLFNLGYLNVGRGDHAEAERYLERAVAARPGDFNARYLLGAEKVALEKREEGLRQWRAALALQPANAKLMMIMAVEYGKGRYFGEACEVAKRGVKAAGTSEEAAMVATKACDDAGDAGVLELTRATLARYPKSARANFEYGFQLQRAGRREEAMPFIKRAMEADGSYEEPYFFYGDLLLLEERYEEAAANLRKALEIRPDYVAACVSLSKALLGMDKAEEAKGELLRCAARSPEHPQPHLFLSQVFFRLGDEERASAEKRLSMRLRRENPTVMEAPQARPFPAKE